MEGGGGDGGGVLSVSSSSSLIRIVFAGEAATGEAAVKANGDQRGFCFWHLLWYRVYSSSFLSSILRLINCVVVLPVVCFLYLHHANSAAQECCTMVSSTNTIYSILVSFVNSFTVNVNTF